MYPKKDIFCVTQVGKLQKRKFLHLASLRSPRQLFFALRKAGNSKKDIFCSPQVWKLRKKKISKPRKSAQAEKDIFCFAQTCAEENRKNRTL